MQATDRVTIHLGESATSSTLRTYLPLLNQPQGALYSLSIFWRDPETELRGYELLLLEGGGLSSLSCVQELMMFIGHGGFVVWQRQARVRGASCQRVCRWCRRGRAVSLAPSS